VFTHPGRYYTETVLLSVLLFLASHLCNTSARLYKEGSWTAAQSALWQCVEAGAANPARAWELTQTYRQLGNHTEGLARAYSALERQPRSVDLLYVTAFLEFRSGKHKDSIDLLGRAFQLNNFDWRVHHLFALNYVVLDIREGARHELEIALKLKPHDGELHYHLARLEYIENRFHESIAASERALVLSPGDARVYDNLGLCWDALGEAARAESNFRKAIEMNRLLGTHDVWPLLNYAAFLTKSSQPELSLPLLDQALRLFPNSSKAYYYQGRAWRRLGEMDRAIASLKRASELDPFDVDVQYALGTLLLRRGDRREGQAAMERFKKLREKFRQKRNPLEEPIAATGPE
jgi:tetratricopeptide (TPR) repeat protein